MSLNLMFKVELDPATKKMHVTLGTSQEFFLALALRHASLSVDNVILENGMNLPQSDLLLPDKIFKGLK